MKQTVDLALRIRRAAHNQQNLQAKYDKHSGTELVMTQKVTNAY